MLQSYFRRFTMRITPRRFANIPDADFVNRKIMTLFRPDGREQADRRNRQNLRSIGAGASFIRGFMILHRSSAFFHDLYAVSLLKFQRNKRLADLIPGMGGRHELIKLLRAPTTELTRKRAEIGNSNAGIKPDFRVERHETQIPGAGHSPHLQHMADHLRSRRMGSHKCRRARAGSGEIPRRRRIQRSNFTSG